MAELDEFIKDHPVTPPEMPDCETTGHQPCPYCIDEKELKELYAERDRLQGEITGLRMALDGYKKSSWHSTDTCQKDHDRLRAEMEKLNTVIQFHHDQVEDWKAKAEKLEALNKELVSAHDGWRRKESDLLALLGRERDRFGKIETELKAKAERYEKALQESVKESSDDFCC